MHISQNSPQCKKKCKMCRKQILKNMAFRENGNMEHTYPAPPPHSCTFWETLPRLPGCVAWQTSAIEQHGLDPAVVAHQLQQQSRILKVEGNVDPPKRDAKKAQKKNTKHKHNKKKRQKAKKKAFALFPPPNTLAAGRGTGLGVEVGA